VGRGPIRVESLGGVEVVIVDSGLAAGVEDVLEAVARTAPVPRGVISLAIQSPRVPASRWALSRSS